jgi:hypothetical protein
MLLRLVIVIAVSMPFAGGALAQVGSDDPKNIIAAQIRDQGYQCNDPQSATRDEKASRPDEADWILQCESGRYRVRLVPDMAAKVERLEGKEDNDR